MDANEAPRVTDRTWTEWQVRLANDDAIAFTSESRDDAEKWLQRLRDRAPYVLASVERRARCESWYGTPTVVPWHSPCSWEGAVGDRDEDLRCGRHGWHRRNEPVPAQFVIGAAS